MPVTNAATALFISSGTWSLIGKLLSRLLTGPAALAANLSNEGGIRNIRFLRNCMGTWVVQELRRAWRARDGREMEWEELNRLTEQGAPFAAVSGKPNKVVHIVDGGARSSQHGRRRLGRQGGEKSRCGGGQGRPAQDCHSDYGMARAPRHP